MTQPTTDAAREFRDQLLLRGWSQARADRFARAWAKRQAGRARGTGKVFRRPNTGGGRNEVAS